VSAKNRARKSAAKGYALAGQVYWTRDMERIIQGIRYSRKMWRLIALLEIPPIIAAIIVVLK